MNYCKNKKCKACKLNTTISSIAKFCPECGKELKIMNCKHCGSFLLLSTEKYCDQCGKEIK